jgi:hypothetical protein
MKNICDLMSNGGLVSFFRTKTGSVVVVLIDSSDEETSPPKKSFKMSIINSDSEEEMSNTSTSAESSAIDGYTVKKIVGDAHCILRCFSEQFDKPISNVISRLRCEFKNNVGKYLQFTELVEEELLNELETYIIEKKYNNSTTDLVLEALSCIFKCHLIIYVSGNICDREAITKVGERFDQRVFLQKKGDHFNLLLPKVKEESTSERNR